MPLQLIHVSSEYTRQSMACPLTAKNDSVLASPAQTRKVKSRLHYIHFLHVALVKDLTCCWVFDLA
jgi:hypothetical protein